MSSDYLTIIILVKKKCSEGKDSYEKNSRFKVKKKGVLGFFVSTFKVLDRNLTFI